MTLPDGASLTFPVFGVSTLELQAVSLAAGLAGFAGDLNQGNFVFGYTLSSLVPLGFASGVEIDCLSCSAVEAYYADLNPYDGLFSTNGVLNTETQPNVGAFALVNAEYGTYTASGGTLTYDTVTVGGQPGIAVILPWPGI